MKKKIAFALLFSLSASPLYAGGIINKSNSSADYFRTLNRQAATDYADIAVHNPAGIMKMKDGKYVKLDFQYIAKDYSNTIPGADELDQNMSSLIPGFFAIHKQEKWACYLTASLVGGGGKIDYKDGNARSVTIISSLLGGLPLSVAAAFPQRVKAESVYTGLTLGGAYAVNDMISVSAGVRYVNAFKKLKLSAQGLPVLGNVVAEIEDEADGVGAIFGVNIAPNDRWNIGIRYETPTKLDFKLNVKEGAPLLGAIGLTDNRKEREDLPGLFGFGASYKLTPELKIDANIIYYLEKDADWETGFDDAGNSYDLGFSLEYTFNKKWKASVGYMSTNLDIDKDQILTVPEEPRLDADTFGAGVVWSPTDAVDITFGGIYASYDDATDSLGIKYEKTVWSFATGLQWKFM